jgi:hypothetical protein
VVGGNISFDTVRSTSPPLIGRIKMNNSIIFIDQFDSLIKSSNTPLFNFRTAYKSREFVFSEEISSKTLERFCSFDGTSGSPMPPFGVHSSSLVLGSLMVSKGFRNYKMPMYE